MKYQRRIKRILDIILSCILLTFFLPVLILIAGILLLLEGRPVFYFSKRVVGGSGEILIPKFRTMVPNATSPQYRLNERFMRNGYLDIPLNCEVYTPIGRLLERTQIVELPQLLCVLNGGMSLIGNRPLPQTNLEFLKQLNGWEHRFDCPSGITGLSQIAGKLALNPNERLELEINYAKIYKHGNILVMDLFILISTILVIISGKEISRKKLNKIVDYCKSKSYP